MAIGDKKDIKLPEQAICRKCVLPEASPDISLDGEGVCNICRAYEKNKALNSKTDFLETEFIKRVICPVPDYTGSRNSRPEKVQRRIRRSRKRDSYHC